jgi:hypothetical protein
MSRNRTMSPHRTRRATASLSLAIAVTFAIGLATTPRAAGAETARLYVEMTTTSDHTFLSVTAASGILFGTTAWHTTDAEAFVDDAGVGLVQPIDRAEAGTASRTEALLEVQRPRTGLVEFELSRGHLGSTTVRIFENVYDEAQLLGSFTWDGINDSPENSTAFAVRLVPTNRGLAPLGYATDPLEAIVDEWVRAILDFDVSAIPLYWPEASHTTIVPGAVHETHNAHDVLREEELAGPAPGVDYRLIAFSEPLRFPALDGGDPKFVCVSTYDDVPSGVDSFWFEERDGAWAIARHAWKLGIDVLR